MKLEKKVSFVMALSIVMIAFMSCSTTTESDYVPTPNPKLTSVAFRANLSVDSAAFEIAKVWVTYLDGQGQKHTEQITSPSWSKTLSTTTSIDTVAYKVFMTSKGEPLTKASYSFSIGSSFSYTLTYDDGKSYLNSGNSGLAKFEPTASEVPDLFNGNLVTEAYQVCITPIEGYNYVTSLSSLVW